MKKIVLIIIVVMSLLLSLTSFSKKASSSNAEILTGQGKGFGGTITATVTHSDGVITDVIFEGPNETETIGGAALKTLAQQIVNKNGIEIDGVGGATQTTEGCKTAVLNALDPQNDPFKETDTKSKQAEWPAADAPVQLPADGSKIVSASTYGLYSRSPNSDQDAVIKATLYWNMNTNSCYAIQFSEPTLPWADTNVLGGWGCITDNALLKSLGDAVVPFSAPATAYYKATNTNYAKYIQIGNIVWTGYIGNTPASKKAVAYMATINGKKVTLYDYCATEEGAKWYVEATTNGNQVYLLTDANVAANAKASNVAKAFTPLTKQNNGHGVSYWSSLITYPGNLQLLKEFAKQTNFNYGTYADGGLTQNAKGYWQTVDAVSGATISQGSTYLEMLKVLYDRIQKGEYTKLN